MIQAIVWALVPTSGAGMSESGPMSASQLGREAPRQRLDLPPAHRSGVAGDAALGAAEGDVHEGALPRHPHGKGPDLVEVGRRGDSGARPWPARARRCAGPGSPVKTRDAAIVEPHREAHRELALRRPERLAHSRRRGPGGRRRRRTGCAPQPGPPRPAIRGRHGHRARWRSEWERHRAGRAPSWRPAAQRWRSLRGRRGRG